MHKLGVERRVYTSGESKVILDPFQPEKPDDVARLKAIQEEVHDLFIDLVRERRGDILQRDNPDIFSGMFWSGKTAVTLGLADRTGDLRSVLRERFGKEVRLKLVSAERNLFNRRAVSIGRAFGTAVADSVATELEERAMRSRYGL